MTTLTPGKVRGLTQTSTTGGVFTILALDHRDSLRVMMSPDAPDAVAPSMITNWKLRLLSELAAEASAVMLDPEYSVAQAIATRTLPGTVGFIAALEDQGYLGDPSAETTLLGDWSVEKAKRMGAGGVKLLVLYGDDAERNERADVLVAGVRDDCARYDIPLFLEPLARHERPGDERRRRIDLAKRLGALGPDVLKLEFPVDTGRTGDRAEWADACRELTESVPVPWALLSGGEPYDVFRDQVATACGAGASGFMVGRAVWREAVTGPAVDMAEVVDDVVRPRLRELCAVAAGAATDWSERFTMLDPDSGWFRSY